jgi:ankyrin repeat protein
MHVFLDVVKVLAVAKGADINVETICGWRALNLACDSGQLEIAKLLVEKGTNVSCQKR